MDTIINNVAVLFKLDEIGAVVIAQMIKGDKIQETKSLFYNEI